MGRRVRRSVPDELGGVALAKKEGLERKNVNHINHLKHSAETARMNQWGQEQVRGEEEKK